MTDAREIIAKAVSVARGETPIGRRWANLSLKDRDTAELGVRRAVAAGYRIIGPDEVDPVTLEKAADAAEERAEWVPLKAGDMRAAVRAIGRKA